MAEAVALALGDDPVLCELAVMEVLPAPDASRLAVRVVAPTRCDIDAVRARLDAQGGRMRAEVAGAVHRKRVPTLFFDVIHGAPASGSSDDSDDPDDSDDSDDSIDDE